MAFNVGLDRLTTEWTPTIMSLVIANVPCVLTSYNRDDAILDAQHLERMGAEIIWQEEWNRWTGQQAPADHSRDELCRFENAFTLGFRGPMRD